MPLTVVVLCGMVIAPLVGELSLAFPTFRGGGAAGVSATAVLALLTPIAIGMSLHADGRSEYVTAARNLRLIDAAMILGYLGISALTALISGLLFDNLPAVVVAVRDAWGLSGLFLTASAFFPWAAAMSVPTLFVFVCALVGRGPAGIEQWAWPIATAGSGTAAVLAGALGIIGLGAALLRPRRE